MEGELPNNPPAGLENKFPPPADDISLVAGEVPNRPPGACEEAPKPKDGTEGAEVALWLPNNGEPIADDVVGVVVVVAKSPAPPKPEVPVVVGVPKVVFDPKTGELEKREVLEVIVLSSPLENKDVDTVVEAVEPNTGGVEADVVTPNTGALTDDGAAEEVAPKTPPKADVVVVVVDWPPNVNDWAAGTAAFPKDDAVEAVVWAACPKSDDVGAVVV